MSHQLVNARASSVAAAYHRLTDTSDFSGVSKVSGEPDPDDCDLIPSRLDPLNCKEEAKVQFHSLNKALKNSHCEPDPDDSSNYQNKLEPDPDDSANYENKLEPDPNNNSNYKNEFEPDPDDSTGSRILESECKPRSNRSIIVQTELSNKEVQPLPPTNSRLLEDSNLSGEPDPDDMGSSSNGKITGPDQFSREMQNLDGNSCQIMAVEPDPDDLGEKQNTLGCGNATEHNEANCLESDLVTDQTLLSVNCRKHDTSQGDEPMQIEPDPDENLVQQVKLSKLLVDEPDPDDQEIQRIQDSVSLVCNRLREAIAKLLAEVKPSESSAVFQTLFKIVR